MSDEYESFIRRLKKYRSPSSADSNIDESSASLDSLMRAHSSNSLTLMLGAGVSRDSKLPSWPELVVQLTEEIMTTTELSDVKNHLLASSLTEIRKVRFLESQARAFRLVIRDCLYKDYNDDSVNSVLDAVVDYISAEIAANRTQKIITYNFDDLLERKLGRIGHREKISPIYSDETCRSAKSLIQIYHPHGYIPHDGSLDELLQSMLVFSELQYHTEYFNQDSWNGLVQTQALTQSTCLFIGMSLSDPNIRRLLDRSRRMGELNHVVIKRRGDKLSDFLLQSDFESLGVRTLWVDDYDEISTILGSI